MLIQQMHSPVNMLGLAHVVFAPWRECQQDGHPPCLPGALIFQSAPLSDSTGGHRHVWLWLYENKHAGWEALAQGCKRIRPLAPEEDEGFSLVCPRLQGLHAGPSFQWSSTTPSTSSMLRAQGALHFLLRSLTASRGIWREEVHQASGGGRNRDSHARFREWEWGLWAPLWN